MEAMRLHAAHTQAVEPGHGNRPQRYIAGQRVVRRLDDRGPSQVSGGGEPKTTSLPRVPSQTTHRGKAKHALRSWTSRQCLEASVTLKKQVQLHQADVDAEDVFSCRGHLRRHAVPIDDLWAAGEGTRPPNRRALTSALQLPRGGCKVTF